MKRFLTFILSLILSLSFFTFTGCKNDDQNYNVVILQESVNVKGTVSEIVDDDTLLISVGANNPYGEIVYVVKENIGDFCVGDYVSVDYNKVRIPKDATKYCELIAVNVKYFGGPPVYKPIIYLYPTVETKVSVSLTLNGYFTCTYPDYGVNGWQNFTAKPDGTLISPEGKEYYALYWEGVLDTDYDLSLGWCIKGSDTAKFLEWALAEQGLTPREANEFIMYWLPLMQDNAYNVISFQTEDYVNNAVLNITPKPDSVLRVFMTYYSSDTMVDIGPQTLKGFTRNGFTVVEWGGSEINK